MCNIYDDPLWRAMWIFGRVGKNICDTEADTPEMFYFDQR